MTAIYTVPIAGGEPRQLTRPEDGATSAAWTKDSREIIYSATEYQGLAALFRIPAGGGQARRITDAAYSALSADVARSGNRLAFTHHSEVHNLWRMDLDRPGSVRRIAPTSRRQDSPDFSPDGQSLLFNSTRSGPRQLWTSNAEGENLMQVTARSVFRTVGRARWSPDGSEIAFGAEQSLLDRDVYVIGARGGVHRAISPGPSHDMFPSFSRDGRWIYFTSDRGGLPQVWRAPRAGGTAVQVTRSVGLVPLESPDGKYILYFNAPKREIWKIPTSGGVEVPVLSGIESYRVWTLAGDTILYLAKQAGDQRERWRIRRFELATGRTADVADLPKRPPADGGALTATADGRTIIWAQVDEATNMIMLIENFR
jgi:Tol biopolymer transport system component